MNEMFMNRQLWIHPGNDLETMLTQNSIYNKEIVE